MVFRWFHKSPLTAARPVSKPEFAPTATQEPLKSATAKAISDSEMLRMQRANLYDVIGECMIAFGILSASYKYKVLSADAGHQQFLILFDLASEFGTDTARLSEMEVLLQTTALRRYRIVVKTCYWRVVPGVNTQAMPAPPQETAQTPDSQPTARAQLHELFADNPVTPAGEAGFAPTEFSASRLPAQEKATSYVLLTGFESTEMANSEFRSTKLPDQS